MHLVVQYLPSAHGIRKASLLTGGTRESIAAALQRLQCSPAAASPMPAQRSGSNPDAGILGVWLQRGVETQQPPATQEAATGRHHNVSQHGMASPQQQTPGGSAAAAPAMAGTGQDSIALRTRGRLRGDADGTELAAAGASAAAAASEDTHGAAEQRASQRRPAVGDGDAAKYILHIAVACAQPRATGTSTSSTSYRSECDWANRGEVLPAANNPPASVPVLQGVWLGSQRLSPAACHIILYPQPAAGRSRLRVASTAGTSGGLLFEGAPAAACSSTPGGALEWAVDCMNGGRQLMSALAAAWAHPAAAQQRHQAGLLWPADAAQRGATAKAGWEAAPPAAEGLLAYSELWQELKTCGRRYHIRWFGPNTQLPPPVTAAGGLHQSADPHASATGGAAVSSMPEAAADVMATDANAVRRVRRRAAAWLSHTMGLGAGCWLLASPQRLAELLCGWAAALAWGCIDPQASSQQPCDRTQSASHVG